MNEDFYINLIYKELAEEINSSEQTQLANWKASSEQHLQTYHAVRQAWTASDQLHANVPDINIEHEFASLEALMEQDIETETIEGTDVRSTAKVRSLSTADSSWLKPFAVAASLFVLAAVAFLLYKQAAQAVASEGTMVEVHSTVTPKQIKLSDGTIVHLNTNSALTYSTVFSASERTVLLNGEAYFEVSHKPKHPFRVTTRQEEITVLGTTFNVKTISDTQTSVYVASGKVEVKQLRSNQKVTLTKGEKAISNSVKQTLQESHSSDNELGWHTKKLVFQQTPMLEVFKHLEALYGVHIKFEPSLGVCSLNNYSIDQQTLPSVLEELGLVFSFNVVQKTKDEYEIKGGKCD